MAYWHERAINTFSFELMELFEDCTQNVIHTYKERLMRAICRNGIQGVEDLDIVVENGFEDLRWIGNKGKAILTNMYNLSRHPGKSRFEAREREQLVPTKRHIITRHRHREENDNEK